MNMLERLALRTLYAAHMLLPMTLVSRHIEWLSTDTARALRALFGGS